MSSSNNENKLILYTNHTCTWANRATIALSELALPYEERIINVDGPRPASFLALNPRGLVPVLIYNDQVLVESVIICQFLADLHPESPLSPPPSNPEGALRRARMGFFIDAYWNKFHTQLFRLFEAPTREDEEGVVKDAVKGLVEEIEPLLGDATPFWGGSESFTLAEVITGPFVVRALALSRHGVYPKSLVALMEEKTPRFWKWAGAVEKNESVTKIFDEEVIVKRSIAKRERMRKAAGLA